MKFELNQQDKMQLEKLTHSEMTPFLTAQRSKILLLKSEGKSSTVIAEELGVNRHTVELWVHVNNTACEAGFDRLATITESGVYKILDKSDIKPFRIQYYCERRNPDFESNVGVLEPDWIVR